MYAPLSQEILQAGAVKGLTESGYLFSLLAVSRHDHCQFLCRPLPNSVKMMMMIIIKIITLI